MAMSREFEFDKILDLDEPINPVVKSRNSDRTVTRHASDEVQRQDSSPTPLNRSRSSRASLQAKSTDLHKSVLALENRRVKVEKNSVYGAAVLMPQVARTLQWPWHFTSMVISSYLHLMLCIFLHGGILMYLAKEQKVIDMFAAQPALCDFAAHLDKCTETNCLGPGGTTITAPRLYDFEQWTLRVYVRDSLKLLFPEKAEEVGNIVDPGEYGVESPWCRILCVVIFVVSILGEVDLCVDMLKLLWYVPSSGEPWVERIRGVDLRTMNDDEEDENVLGKTVQVTVAGMPRSWKIINLIFVWLPKCALVYITASAGVAFLMETSGINDLIVNAVALKFLLDIDELITQMLLGESTSRLLAECADMAVPDRSRTSVYPQKVPLDAKGEANDNRSVKPENFCNFIVDLFFHQLGRMIWVFCISLVLQGQYFLMHCEWRGGQYVSQPVYAPKSMHFTFLNAFFGLFYPVPSEEEASWTMP